MCNDASDLTPLNTDDIVRAIRTASPELLARLDPETLETVATLAGVSSGELLGGLSGTCPGCPFNDGLTEIASQGQNYGCLPSARDIVELNQRTGQRWGCHDDETRVCAGLCHQAQASKLNLTTGGIVSYHVWSRKGQDVAVDEARRTTKLIFASS